jgi:FkbM family methyltransferase
MRYVSYSLSGEDILLARALADVSPADGFYIDVGANDPEHGSVTKLLYDLGWHGINIEPSPVWYERLVQSRTRDINLNLAVGAEVGTATLYDHAEGGLGTLLEDLADRHVIELGLTKREIEVSISTLSTICTQYCSAEIHFLKIDVEGFEKQVLLGMDFIKYRPWIICIEAIEPKRDTIKTHHNWEYILQDSGYRFALFDGVNRWYVADEHEDLLSRLGNKVDDYVHYSYLKTIRRLRRRVSELRAAMAAYGEQE